MENLRDPGATLKIIRASKPVATGAGAGNGETIDRDGFESCVLSEQLGDTAGTPTSFTVDGLIEHAEDTAGPWTTFTPNSGSATLAQLTAANTATRVSVNLLGASRYIRHKRTVAFVGGTTPTVVASATFVLTAPNRTPTSYT